MVKFPFWPCLNMGAFRFDSNAYGERVAAILALDGAGERLMPLAHGTCSNKEAARLLHEAKPRALFPRARHPEAAMSGLWMYFSCLDQAHKLAQDTASAEGSFWHGIMHRQEPDPGNAAYWFRRVGRHRIFPALQEEAAGIRQRYAGLPMAGGEEWDPFAFIDYCESARRKPKSDAERLAMEIQRAEWQLLFDWCAKEGV